MDLYHNPIARSYSIYSNIKCDKFKCFRLKESVADTELFVARFNAKGPHIEVRPVGGDLTPEMCNFVEKIEPWMDPDIAEKIINLLPYLDDKEKQNEFFDVYEGLPWINHEYEVMLLPSDAYGGYFYIRNPTSDFEDDRFFGKDTPLLSFYIAAMFAEEQRAYGMDWNGNVL